MRFVALLVVAACGSGAQKQPTQPQPPPEKPDPYLAWHDTRPKEPAEPMRSTRFTPPQQCGQGPYRFVVDTLSSKFQEGVSVTVCTPRGFRGSFSYQPPKHERTEKGFGEDHESNHKCRGDATVIASQGTGSSGGSTTGKPGPRGKAGKSEAAKPVAVGLSGTVVETGEHCPQGTRSVSLLISSYLAFEDPTEEPPPPLPKGPFVFELWSDLPNDLSGVTVLVEQRGVKAGYTVEQWIAYRKAYRAWYAQHDAKLAESIAQGHEWRTVDPIVATKQPPPARPEARSPKPSPNAAWIPGYWQDNDGWVWSAGFWRVPEEDVAKEKTVEAPAPPPAPKVDAAPKPDVAYYTARRAVWTPGYWMWNGAVYVWVAGSWRIPEQTGMTWVAPTWRPTRRGTSIYIPGGFVRIRKR